MWTVIAGKPVRRKLEKIPNLERERLYKALKKLENGPENLDIKPMAGRDDYRFRVGKWRMLIEIHEDEKFIFIRSLDSRGQIYKDL